LDSAGDATRSALEFSLLQVPDPEKWIDSGWCSPQNRIRRHQVVTN